MVGLPLVLKQAYIKSTNSFFSKTVAQLCLKENGNDQNRENIDDFDHRIDRGSARVLVGVSDRVAGDGSLVCFGAFAAEISLLDEFLGVFPRCS